SGPRPQDHRSFRAAGKRITRRDPARRSDGGAAARRDGRAHHCDRRRDRGDGELTDPTIFVAEVTPLPVTARSNATKQSIGLAPCQMDCFAEPVIGRRYVPTRWLAMTASAPNRPAAQAYRLPGMGHSP